MGKRELVLVGIFVVLGIAVYQFTAPPPVAGSEGFSVGGLFRNMKRGIQGARESASADTHQTVAIDSNVRDLRINIPRMSDVTVTGEDRADVAAEMHATARGFDQAEAKAAAAVYALKLERVGDAVVVSLDNSAARTLPRNAGFGQFVILLRAPRRLALRVEPHFGTLVVSHLAAVEIMGSRGETRVTDVKGRVALTHSGGALELDGLASLKLNARNSRGAVKRVNGPMTLDAIAGELTISDVVGPLEIEGRNTDITMDGLTRLTPPLRVNSTGGEIRIEGLRTEARVDGRNSVVEVILGAPAPVTIYNLGEIRVTAPPGGYTLDAAATEGRIIIEDGDLKPSEGNDPHVTAPVRGGGPPLTIRSTRGSITVRSPAGK
jgi:hypothetical protein